MKNSLLTLAITAAISMGGAANAQIAGNLLGAPLVAGGSTLSGAAAGHAGVAPVVNQAVPNAEPVTDGVTNALAAAGGGALGTGVHIQQNGLEVGATGNGQPLASVGATNPANQGTVAAVANGRP